MTAVPSVPVVDPTKREPTFEMKAWAYQAWGNLVHADIWHYQGGVHIGTEPPRCQCPAPCNRLFPLDFVINQPGGLPILMGRCPDCLHIFWMIGLPKKVKAIPPTEPMDA